MLEKIKKGRGIVRKIGVLFLTFCLIICLVCAPAFAADVSMYSYNGKILPGLPEWDKETYPYALIRLYPSDSTYTAFFFQSPLIEYQNSNDSCYVVFPGDTVTSYCSCKLNGDTWSDVTVSTIDRTGMSRWRLTIYTVFWSNFDIPNTDGTTYLAASDPVEAADISAVTVTPSTHTMYPGDTQKFVELVVVFDSGDYDSSVTWSVTGNTSTSTVIDNSSDSPTFGYLTVGADETSTSLIVTATSVQDPSVYGTALVTVVVQEEDPDPETSSDPEGEGTGSGSEGEGSGTGEGSGSGSGSGESGEGSGSGSEGEGGSSGEGSGSEGEGESSGSESESGSVLEQEEEKANTGGNESVEDLTEAIPDYSEEFIVALEDFAMAFSYEGTEAILPIPPIVMPGIAGLIPETTLLSSIQFDFGEYIGFLPDSLLLLAQSLLTIALIIFCFKELYDAISYALTLKKGEGSN